ncbi:MAG: cache domain-containing protein [Geobacteraceae bacterium]|nr:cache domain-containing protein [Geobacteraceae bacterium]
MIRILSTIRSKATAGIFTLCTLFVCLVASVGLTESSGIVKVKAAAQTEEQKEIARRMVHDMAVGLGGALANLTNETERIELIRSVVAPIRFYPDDSGYFYVYDSKCVNIAHAIQKELQGKNLYNYQDAKSKYVIRALNEAAIKGGGFVSFHWVKPGAKEESAKLGYVEPIPGTDYFIGTGVYLP